MKFLKQIRIEIANILKSRFLLIIGILVVAWSIAIPVISVISSAISKNGGGPGVRPLPGGIYYAKEAVAYSSSSYYGGGEGDPITVDGVTVANDNPFYWQISSAIREKEMMSTDKGRFTTPEALDLAIALMDAETQYYLHFAQYVTKQPDYRADLAWGGVQNLYEKFIYEHLDSPQDVLMEAMTSRKGMDPESFKKLYVDTTPDERQAAYRKADEALNTLFSVVEKNDFEQYINLSIQQQNDQIEALKENIAIQEQAIIDNPSQEENNNRIIEDLKRQMQDIESNAIPILRYRLEKHIVPYENVWQNTAISDVQNNRSELLYLSSSKITEEDFNKDMGYKQQYGSYQSYLAAVQKQIDDLNSKILIAQNSLDAGKPDMKYVQDSSRSRTVGFLDFSVIIALFGVLLGGWIMASEFQQGTVRLLMIRPRTRTKILLAKFTAALLVCLAMYIISCLLNIVANGICFGFSDYAFPNYTVGGEINFFAYYLPEFAACIITILFAYAAAFMFSVLTKNTAVAIAIPIVCFIGCFLFMNTLAFRGDMSWIAYTPVPYVQISSFFLQNSTVQNLLRNGMPLSLPLGIAMLAVLSAACVFVSALVFKKRDITN